MPTALPVRLAQSPRAGKWDTSRLPDLTVIPTQQWRELRNREAVIELNEPPPILVHAPENTDYAT